MYVVIETGGKQYKVTKDAVLCIERVPGAHEKLTIDTVLLAADGANIFVGTPYVKGAHVTFDVLGEVRGDKVVAFKYKKRKSEKKKIGHRETYTKVRAKEIHFAKA